MRLLPNGSVRAGPSQTPSASHHASQHEYHADNVDRGSSARHSPATRRRMAPALTTHHFFKWSSETYPRPRPPATRSPHSPRGAVAPMGLPFSRGSYHRFVWPSQSRQQPCSLVTLRLSFERGVRQALPPPQRPPLAHMHQAVSPRGPPLSTIRRALLPAPYAVPPLTPIRRALLLVSPTVPPLAVRWALLLVSSTVPPLAPLLVSPPIHSILEHITH